MSEPLYDYGDMVEAERLALRDALASGGKMANKQERSAAKILRVEFLLLGGHTVSGEITEIQLGTLMGALSMPHDRRTGYIRIDESAVYVYEVLIPSSHIAALRYEKTKEE